MDNYVDIAVVGDYNFNFASHVATNRSLSDVENVLSVNINFFWIDTKSVEADPAATLSRFDGVWIAPGPYANARGVLGAIRYARESGLPLLGTSAGCQFMILEFARNVLGVNEATSFFAAEGKGVITRKDTAGADELAMENIFLMEGSKAFRYYPQEVARECSSKKLTISGELLDYLVRNGLKPAGIDEEGDIRIFEHTDHPFMLGTLFLPQLTSRGALPHPVITNFIKSSHKHREEAFLVNEAMVG